MEKRNVLSVPAKVLAVIMAVFMLLCTTMVAFTANAAEEETETPEYVPGGGEGCWVETDGTIRINGTGALSTAYYNQKTGYAIYLPKNYENYANNPDGEKLAVMLVMSGGSKYLNGEYYYMSLVTSLNYLADKEGIMLIYVRSDNETINQNFAWAWWQPSDYTRDRINGYVPQRVTELLKDVKNRYKDSIDDNRTYLAGLSAGGSMAATLAALYPDVFDGAIIVGGTPFKAVTALPMYYRYVNFVPTLALSYQHAYNAMHYGTGDKSETPYEFEKDPTVLGRYIKRAWNDAGVTDGIRVAIFHGTADTIVRVENGQNIAMANAYARYGHTNPSIVEERIGYKATFYGTNEDLVSEGYSNDRSSDIALYEFEGMGHAWVSNRSEGDWSATSDKFDFNLMIWEFLEGGIHEDEPEEFEIKSVTHEVIDDKIIFSIVTNRGDANRIKVGVEEAPNKSIAVTDKYTVNADGNYVWTAKVNAPEKSTVYSFDARNSDGKYYKNYFYYNAEIEIDEPVIKSVESEVVNGKIYFTVVTSSGEYNRIKVTTADNLSGSIAVVNTYTIDADGNYVWTIKATEPTETTSYAFDLRTTENKYTKNYYLYDYSVEETIKSVSCTESNGKLTFTVVTVAGDYNRLRCGLSESISDNILNANSYIVNSDGDYVWNITVGATAGDTEYYFDLRNATTGKYIKDFFVYTYTV